MSNVSKEELFKEAIVNSQLELASIKLELKNQKASTEMYSKWYYAEKKKSELNPEIEKALKGFINDFEGDYVVDGKIVDEPLPLAVDHYIIVKELLNKALK